MSITKKYKRTFFRNKTARYEQALNLYLNEDKPDEALEIFLKLAKKGYKKAYGEIGVIMYRENHQPDIAEEWFIKAEKAGVLFEEASYEYGMLHYLEKNDWKTGFSYFFKAAEKGYGLAYGDIGVILYLYRSDFDGAESWFQKAEKYESLLAPAAYYYGQLLMSERHEFDKSKKYFKQSAEECFDLALDLDKIDVDEAEAYFKKAVEVDWLPAPHAYNYGKLLIEERNEVERGNKYLDLAKSERY